MGEGEFVIRGVIWGRVDVVEMKGERGGKVEKRNGNVGKLMLKGVFDMGKKKMLKRLWGMEMLFEK